MAERINMTSSYDAVSVFSNSLLTWDGKDINAFINSFDVEILIEAYQSTDYYDAYYFTGECEGDAKFMIANCPSKIVTEFIADWIIDILKGECKSSIENSTHLINLWHQYC